MRNGEQAVPAADDHKTENREREVGTTQRETLDAAPYEVEFMNVVVDRW